MIIFFLRLEKILKLLRSIELIRKKKISKNQEGLERRFKTKVKIPGIIEKSKSYKKILAH